MSRISRDDLTRKALLALEETLCAASRGAVPKSLWLRFTLAYLYSVSKDGERGCFNGFWRSVTDKREGRGGGLAATERTATANAALNGIFGCVGVERTSAFMFNEKAWRGEVE